MLKVISVVLTLFFSALISSSSVAAQTTFEVQPGLTIPNSKTVWAVDSFNNQPQLVPIHHATATLNRHTGSNLAGAAVGSFFYKPNVTTELDGISSRNVLHTSTPVLYVFIDEDEGADDKSSDQFQWVLERAVVTKGKRIVDRIAYTQLTGNGKHIVDTIETEITQLPNKWYRIMPKRSLQQGEYVLLPILKDKHLFSLMVWDFTISPNAPNSKEAIVSTGAAK